MKRANQQIQIVLLIIFSIMLLAFIGCDLSSDNYEGIEYEIGGEQMELRYNTMNYIDYNYYHLEATDKDETMLIKIIFPANDIINVFDIPYDQDTRINYHDLETGYIYSASAYGGNGLIMIDSSADSLFNELSGTFECDMVNVADETDTLTIINGYFVYIF